jgi:hypothetical protein
MTLLHHILLPNEPKDKNSHVKSLNSLFQCMVMLSCRGTAGNDRVPLNGHFVSGIDMSQQETTLSRIVAEGIYLDPGADSDFF